MISVLILNFAFAACTPLYGSKDADGFMTLSWTKMPGMQEIVLTESCRYDVDLLELADGKWSMNQKKQEFKKDGEKKLENIDQRLKVVEGR